MAAGWGAGGTGLPPSLSHFPEQEFAGVPGHFGSLLHSKLPAASWGQTKQGKAAPEPGKAACSLALGFCCPGCVPARIRPTQPCSQSSQQTEATRVLPQPTTAQPASTLQAPAHLSLAMPIAKGLVGRSKTFPAGC